MLLREFLQQYSSSTTILPYGNTHRMATPKMNTPHPLGTWTNFQADFLHIRKKKTKKTRAFMSVAAMFYVRAALGSEKVCSENCSKGCAVSSGVKTVLQVHVIAVVVFPLNGIQHTRRSVYRVHISIPLTVCALCSLYLLLVVTQIRGCIINH